MKAKTKTRKTAPRGEFSGVFRELRAILEPMGSELVINQDTPSAYYVDTPGVVIRGKPVFFALVRLGKNYVSYHLMPVYASPDLQKQISPALRTRMPGKSCFNFTHSDPAAFSELARLTRAGLERFTDPSFWRKMEEMERARKQRGRR